MTGHLRLVDRAELPMDSGEDHKQRFRALRNIERAMIRSEAPASGNSGVPSPIGGQALVVGACVLYWAARHPMAGRGCWNMAIDPEGRSPVPLLASLRSRVLRLNRSHAEVEDSTYLV